MAEKIVVCEVSTGVARIILNRPPVNAVNLEMIKDVVTAFEPCDGPIRRPLLAAGLNGRSSLSDLVWYRIDLHPGTGFLRQRPPPQIDLMRQCD